MFNISRKTAKQQRKYIILGNNTWLGQVADDNKYGNFYIVLPYNFLLSSIQFVFSSPELVYDTLVLFKV